MVIDKIGQFYRTVAVHPRKAPIMTAYQSTVEGSPLRRLLRNMWLYETNARSEKRFQESEFPYEFLHDVLKRYMSIKNSGPTTHNSFFDIKVSDGWMDQLKCKTPYRCRYHQHDDEHPFCLPDEEEEGHCESCRAAKNP
jgi:hypothetical protein